jgi:hypothetical protein
VAQKPESKASPHFHGIVTPTFGLPPLYTQSDPDPRNRRSLAVNLITLYQFLRVGLLGYAVFSMARKTDFNLTGHPLIRLVVFIITRQHSVIDDRDIYGVLFRLIVFGLWFFAIAWGLLTDQNWARLAMISSSLGTIMRIAFLMITLHGASISLSDSTQGVLCFLILIEAFTVSSLIHHTKTFHVKD